MCHVQVDAALTSEGSSPDAFEVGYSNFTSTPTPEPKAEALYNNDDSVDSSATSWAPGMKAGRHSAFTSSPYTTPEVERDGVTSSAETSPGTHDSPFVEINDEDIERMMMSLKVGTDLGDLGFCSEAERYFKFHDYNVGDTYQCTGINDIDKKCTITQIYWLNAGPGYHKESCTYERSKFLKKRFEE